MINTDLENASKIMIGSQEAEAIYVGSTPIWQSIQLPYDAEIEYLESSGTQWIDTGITPNTNTKVQFKFKNFDSTGNVIIGYYIGNDRSDWRFFNYDQRAYFDLPVNNNDRDGMRIVDNNENSRIYKSAIYELELGNYYVKNLNTNTILVSGEPQTYTGISTITLNYYDSSRISKNEFYYVKIYDGDTLVRDLIPVRIGQIGYMYDKVSNTLFGNSGTGDFILGPDI